MNGGTFGDRATDRLRSNRSTRWPVASACLAMLVLAPAVLGADPARPRTPEEERATFRFADGELVAELAAAEPEVRSPVALAWDAAGRMYVAEMRDYPNASEGGAIRRLVDRDGDGRYETSTVFADRLPFPNSVLPWNDGVLVTAAPDLWFLRDRDGDGVAEERQVLFTGFGTGNQQLRANGLLWGLDGWVYGANGRSDGEIRRVYDPASLVGNRAGLGPAGSTNAVSLRGRDFRFRPDTGAFETLAGRSQFGLSRDDWGNRFLSWNTILLRHEVFADRYLASRPDLAALEVLQDGLPDGDRGEVFPLTPPPLVFNNESGGHFNALSGLHLFRGDALGPEYAGNAFVGESLRNLVHCRVLVPEGPTFRAERRETGTEFLASDDPWFHPVQFATGPDGALYIADFYRQFVEHPDWVAREMRDRIAWDTGRDFGRIWRVRRRGAVRSPEAGVALRSADPQEWVGELASANGWRRDTAHRLLVERRDPAVAPALRRKMAPGDPPETRVAALRVLEVLGVLPAEALAAALDDEHPRMRSAAAQILANRGTSGERWGAATPVFGALVRRTQDPDERVRLEALLALGVQPAGPERDATLERAGREETNRWVVLAAAAGLSSTNAAWLSKVHPAPRWQRPPPRPVQVDPDRERVVQSLRPALERTGDRARGAALCARLCLSCHYLQGQGQRVGPDLAGLGGRPAETLLVDVLDPSRQVAPDYQPYEFVLTDDSRLTGLLASESETRVTVRQPGSPDLSLARRQIREIRPTGRSLMPDGLESGLTVGDVADLLAFLRSPDAALLPR